MAWISTQNVQSKKRKKDKETLLKTFITEIPTIGQVVKKLSLRSKDPELCSTMRLLESFFLEKTKF